MVLLTRKIEFAASHLYHNPNFSAEENRRIFGKCNNPHGHGQKEILEREIMQRMDHRHLNYEVAELAGKIPTCENITRVIWQLLEPKIKQGRLHRVRLYESPDLFADCFRNGSGAAGNS